MREKVMLKKIRKGMMFFVFGLAYLLVLMVYKTFLRNGKKKVVGFASSFFGGNIKYLYQEMKNYVDVKMYFVTGNKSELDRLKSSSVETYYYMDIICIPLFLKTKVWVTSHGPANIPFIGAMHTICARVKVRPLGVLLRYFLSYWTKTRNSKWVDVWHAVEVKDVGREKMLMDYDLGFVTSEFYKQYYSKKARIWSKLKITGNARTDPLIKRSWNRKKLLQEMGIPFDRKNVFYAPTWGHGKRKAFLPWGTIIKNIEDLEEFCEKNNCSFLIRMHPNWYRKKLDEKKKLEEAIKRSERIFDLSPQEYTDVQHILYITDVLITDWSSIANDFILLERPIIFIDTKLPVKELILKPEKRSGYTVKGEREFFETLEEALVRPNLFEEKRRMLVEKMYKHLDGDSSRRCVEEIIRLLKA